MAVLKYKNSEGQFVSLTNYTVQPITPVQTTGHSLTDVMSQRAVTFELDKKADSDDIDGLMSAYTYDKATIDSKISSGGTFDPTAYYSKSETSGKTELSDAFNEKFDDAEYTTSGSSKVIAFKANGIVKKVIDATDFIKDGMVNSVEISGNNLVITFNTDSGKDPISIPLTSIFNPGNYYTKSETSGKTELSDAFNAVNSELFLRPDGPKVDNMIRTYAYAKTETSGKTELSDAFNEKFDSAELVEYPDSKKFVFKANGVAKASIDAAEAIMVEIRHEDLVSLKSDSDLVPGRKYRIIDYQASTVQEGTSAATNNFDIVVTALSEKTLDENAKAVAHSGDTYFTNSDLNAWEIKYSLENDTDRFAWADEDDGKGVIYYMKDELGNEAPYDFKNIMFRHPSLFLLVNGNSTTVRFQRNPRLDKNDFYAWSKDGIVLSSQSGGNVNAILYTNTDTPTTSTTLYSGASTSDTTYGAFTVQYFYDGYVFTFNTNQHEPSIFGNVIKEYYTIVDNKVKLTLNNIVCLGICKENSFAVGCHDNSLFSSSNNTFGDGSSYNVLASAATSNYLASDCSGNTLAVNSTRNTLGQGSSNNYLGEDSKDNVFGNDCYRNSFGNNCYNNSFGNYFQYNSFGNECYRNSFGNECYNNSFGNSCYNNSFGNSCYNNSFGNYCYNNSFGNNCYYNSFGNECYNNSFGNECYNNSFGDECGSNTFGNECSSNSFGNECYNNFFENDCYSNSFKDSCNRNSFGNVCYSNTFVEWCYNNSLGNYCRNIKFATSYTSDIIVENGNTNILLKSDAATSSTNSIRNITFAQGFSNTETTRTFNVQYFDGSQRVYYKNRNGYLLDGVYTSITT